MANRSQLHRTKLNEFLKYARNHKDVKKILPGKEEDYQIVKIYTHKAKHPIVIYDRSQGDHYTVTKNGQWLLNGFTSKNKIKK